MAKTPDEYNDIRVGVERTLVGMARHSLKASPKSQ